MTGKLPRLWKAWRRVIGEEAQQLIQTHPLLRLAYRLGCEARRVMSPENVVIEVPAARMSLQGHAPTVTVSPKTHQVELPATAKGVPTLETRHIPAIVSDKNFRRFLLTLLPLSIALILIPVALTAFLSLPKEIEVFLRILPNIGYVLFAAFLAAWLSRASAAPDS